MRVTNRGQRKWEVGFGEYVMPGQTVNVTEDSWRLALDLNPAMPYAVGSELVIEEEAQPALPAVLEEEVVFVEHDVAPPAVELEPEQPRRKKGRR